MAFSPSQILHLQTSIRSETGQVVFIDPENTTWQLAALMEARKTEIWGAKIGDFGSRRFSLRSDQNNEFAKKGL